MTMKIPELFEWTKVAYEQVKEEEQKLKGEQEITPGL